MGMHNDVHGFNSQLRVFFRRWKASLRPATVVLLLVVVLVVLVVTVFEKCLRLC